MIALSIDKILPAAMRLGAVPERGYKPVRYELGYHTEGLAVCVNDAHRAVQWWLNDILHGFKEGRRWLTLYGRSGCGKSHLMTAASAYLKAGLPVRSVQCWNWGVLMGRLLGGECPGLMEQVQRMPVLMLDDVGSELVASERAQSVAMRLLYDVLEARLGRWTMLTSNLAPADLPDVRVTSRLFRGMNEVVDMSAAGDYAYAVYKQRML